MNDAENFALVPRPSGALEKAEPGARRILSGMVADTLALTKKEPPNIKRPLSITMVFSEPGAFKSLEITIRYFFRDVSFRLFQDSAEKAWREFSCTEPDLLIITADAMPGLRGKEIVRRLLDQKATLPIIVISAFEPAEQWVQDYANEGLNVRFLAMPWTIEEVRMVLEASLKITLAEEHVAVTGASVVNGKNETKTQMIPAAEQLASLPTRRIIHVDDDWDFLDLYRGVLRAAFKNIEVLSFTDGNAAWRELLHAPPDLLISDINRPGGRLPIDVMLPRLAQMKISYPIMTLSAIRDTDVLGRLREIAGPELNILQIPKPENEEDLRAFLREVARLLGVSEPDFRFSAPQHRHDNP